MHSDPSVRVEGQTKPEWRQRLDSAFLEYRRFVIQRDKWLSEVPARERERLGKALTRVFVDFVVFITECLSGELAADGWARDDRYPGYLVRQVNGIDVRVPFNLVVGLPRAEALEEALAYAMAIRAPRQTLICLSGSAMHWHEGVEPADLDFCEYVEASEAENDGNLADIFRHAISISAERLSWILIKSFEPEDYVPRGSAAERIEYFLGIADQVSRGKCSFVAITESWGTLEVTKVVLMPIERTASWAHQELPVDATWVPHELVNVESIRAYVKWLEGEIDKLIQDDDVIKAARRMVALGRLMFWDDLAERAQRFLASRGRRGIVHSRLRLLESLRSQSVPELQAFETSLRADIRNLIYEGHPPEPSPEEDWNDPLKRFVISDDDRKQVGNLRQDFARRIRSLA